MLRIKKCKANHKKIKHNSNIKEIKNMMNVMNAASMSAIAVSMVLVTFLSAKSYLVVSNLAKAVDKK